MLSGHPEALEQFHHALKLGQAERCRTIAWRAKTEGRATDLIETLLAPAMVAIGDEWSTGLISVYEERRATSIVCQLVAEHGATTSGRQRGRAVVASVDEEWHGLPTDMATAALREDGWAVEHLGAGVPSRELLNGCMPRSADIVVLSVTMDKNRQRTMDTAAALSEQGLHVLVGGAGQALSELQRAARRATDP
jgi:methanogenic corrinoid protein MtbC1